MQTLTGDKEYFKGIGQIKYEGPDTDNPLSYRWYGENKVAGGKTMKAYLRFAMAYWHSFVNEGSDSFGSRYTSFNSGKGQEFGAGKLSLEDLRNYAVEQGEPVTISDRQE